MRLFGRESELSKLASWIQTGRSFIFYGPTGVGKTRLLDEIAPAVPSMLRISSCSTPKALFREVISALWKRGHPELRKRFKSVEQLRDNSVTNMKGLFLLGLKGFESTLVLDNVHFSSQQLTAALKEATDNCGFPLIFVARSCHMEDAGYLVRRYADRSERLELSDFDSSTAKTFASFVASEVSLEAENLAEFLNQIVELSEGNPGAIVSMIRMASTSKYRSGDLIKSTLLYIDFRLARNASV